ncbi:hypothetical protein DL96DRAFT_1585959 [Flagelloscypha sp. PMI_526]|nr:hypothetical protein DL96DRAFT_1585959 [Flagelloscypha sp. PMI_526]
MNPTDPPDDSWLSTAMTSLLHGTRPLSTLARTLSCVIFVLWLVRRRKNRTQLISDLAQVGSSYNAEYEEDKSHFDIIIAGGGTSGCVLAARLSEDPNVKVLLLDAGQSSQTLEYSRIPSGFGRLLRSTHAFPLWTTPQTHASNKPKFWPRAKVLGGCSAMNAMMAQYGSPSDFDAWAQEIQDPSWAWKNLSKYFRKFETFVAHPDYPDVDLGNRGKYGPVTIGYFNSITQTSKAFVKACVEVGMDWTPDFLMKSCGVSRVLTYVDKRFQRVSAESAYLTPEVLKRPNLKVAINARVLRILFDTKKSRPRAIGVEYSESQKLPPLRSFAKKEVIISAGAVHSPHILMLSGIGPSFHLRVNKIPLLQDLPGVGQHLTDHCVVDAYFKDKTESSFKFFRPSGLSEFGQLMKAAWTYRLGFGGPLASNFGECGAFFRSDDPVLFPPKEFHEKLVDTTSGPESPDLEIFSTPFAYRDHGVEWFDALHCYLLRPASRGEVRLTSSNPWSLPSVNPNYLQSPADIEKLLRGLRLMLRIAQTEALNPYLDESSTHPSLDHSLHLKSDEELLQLIRDRLETVYHPTSTCRMAPLEKGGVVDGELRVYGVQGLRVCDASVFTEIVSGHTAGACYAIAEKLADDIKLAY